MYARRSIYIARHLPGIVPLICILRYLYMCAPYYDGIYIGAGEVFGAFHALSSQEFQTARVERRYIYLCVCVCCGSLIDVCIIVNLSFLGVCDCVICIYGYIIGIFNSVKS